MNELSQFEQSDTLHKNALSRLEDRIKRISKALARLHYDTDVSPDDIIEACRLIKATRMIIGDEKSKEDREMQ